MTWTTRPRSEIGGLAAITAGSGPTTVLLLHGVGLRAEAWGAQIDALAEAAYIVSPDMPGHGQSETPPDALPFTDYVQTALRVAHALPAPLLVVGHSMGAMLALELAARAPDRIRAVAALNAVFERSPDAAQAVQARAAQLDGVTPADPSPTLTRWFGTAPSPERDACADWLRQIDPAAYKSAYTAFAHSTAPDRATLSALQIPALFLTGALEPNSTPAMSSAMAGIAPQGRAKIIDGAAHMMPMTHRREVNAALRALLDEARQ